jgi:hypothetical protein
MTWFHFAIWLLVIYGAYYGAVIIWDLLKGRQPAKVASSNVLTFTDQVALIKPEYADEPISGEPATKGHGGVDLKQLFALCRDETIEYRRAVSY